jgi:hypothetical protein
MILRGFVMKRPISCDASDIQTKALVREERLGKLPDCDLDLDWGLCVSLMEVSFVESEPS